MRASRIGLHTAACALAATGLALAISGTSASAQTSGVPLKPTVTDAAAPSGSAGQKSAAAPAAPAAKPTTKTAPAPAAGKSSTATPPAKSAAAKPSAPGATKKKSGQSIVVLVGDDPITGYEIEQRQRLLTQGSGIGQAAQARFQSMIKSEATKQKMQAIQEDVVKNNPGKSRDQLIAMIKARMQEYGKSLQRQAVESTRAGAMSGLREKALEQLIDERLMIQEAKRVGTLATEEDVNKVFADKAQRAKVTTEQYTAQFKGQGVDIETLRALYRAQMSWQDAIRRRFGYQIQVTEREVDRIASSRPKDAEDDVELQVQRIILPMPEKLDQKIMAKRFQEAEAIWRKFDGCKSLPALSNSAAGGRLENVGPVRPSAIPEPTRGLLLNTSDNSMIPPSVGQAGMELWAVCGRSVVKADDKQREAIEVQLRKEQFGLLADRHLKDLRKDTPIEYR